MQADMGEDLESKLHTGRIDKTQTRISGQLPLAAVRPFNKTVTNEWWTVSGRSSMDVSDVLQATFVKTCTGREGAEHRGMSVVHCSGVKRCMQLYWHCWQAQANQLATHSQSTVALRLPPDCCPSASVCVLQGSD